MVVVNGGDFSHFDGGFQCFLTKQRFVFVF